MTRTLLVLLLISGQAFAQSWGDVGGAAGGTISVPGDESVNPQVAVDTQGRISVAWIDFSSGKAQVYLKRWNGSAWTELAGSATGDGVSGAEVRYDTSYSEIDLALVLDAAGNPCLAWASGEGRICLKHWTGIAWAEYVDAVTGEHSGGGQGIGGGLEPRLALDLQGNPVVAWDDWYHVFVRHWNGAQSKWEYYGGSSPAAGGIATPWNFSTSGDDYSWFPSLSIDEAGKPLVAWIYQDSTNGRDCVYLKKWNGTGWVELGGSASGPGIGGSTYNGVICPVVRCDATGKPWVAWRSATTGGFHIQVRTWNGGAWEGAGGSDADGGISGVIDPGPEIYHALSLQIDDLNRPVVAWEQWVITSYDIRLKQWNGSAWTGIAGSDSGGGISMSSSASRYPAVALVAPGQPVVAWEEAYPGSHEIMLRRFYPPPAPPVIASGLSQVPSKGGPAVTTGATIPDLGFSVTAVVTDANLDRVWLTVEVKPVGVDFNGLGTFSGPPSASGGSAKTDVTGLALGTAYHWRVRALDGTLASAWVSFGGNPESEADLRIRDDTPPAFSGAIARIAGRATDGPVTNQPGTRLEFSAVVTDADAGDTVSFEVELRRRGEAFEGVATLASALVAVGTTVVLDSAASDGEFAWRARSVDQIGTPSAWIAGGTFTLLPNGSEGTGGCLGAATGGSGWSFAILIFLIPWKGNR